MAIVKSITIASINALKPGEQIRDPIVKGFGARRLSATTTTYFVQTRINARLRWITIGKHGSPWTPEQARNRAKDILFSASKNIDLLAEEHAPSKNITIEAMFALFLHDREPHFKPATLQEYRRMADTTILPHFTNRTFSGISRAEVSEFHRSLSKTPSTANHALAVLKQVYNWADAMGHFHQKNPCLTIKMFKSKRRATFLTTDEVSRLAEACRLAMLRGEATQFTVAAILTLLFTGARRNEIFTLKRSYVDMERLLVHLPDSKTGAKVLHLNQQAAAILKALPEIEGNPYFFVGRNAKGHISEIYKPWSKIRQYAKLQHLRLHDLRHSFASFAADTGASARAVGALLGHATVETTKLYIHLFNNRARETAEATGNVISTAINSQEATPPPSNHASASSATDSGHESHKELEPFFPAQAG